ncbi:MAG: hypothetical protein LC795_07530 [Acidobacteria bacterium]|nr:hypothetical protein [Acidobacteriota bacterium]
MRLTILTLLLSVLLIAPACGGGGGVARNANAQAPAAEAKPAQAPASAAPAPQLPRSATCALLPDDEVREVHGEAPAEAQGTEHSAGALSMSQCFYRLPTFARSFNLEVTRAAQGAPAGALREHWRKLFSPEAVEERARRREREEAPYRAREETLKREQEAGQVREGGRRRKKDKEAEDGPPRRVEGVGLEAYWSGNKTVASLYVLAKDAVVRVSPAAGEEEDVKIRKAVELARRALRRL